MKHILLTIFLIFEATAASAGFYNDRSDWNELRNFKQYYVMGLFDEISLQSLADDGARLKFKDNLVKCMIQYDVKSNTLVDLVDNYYQDVAN